MTPESAPSISGLVLPPYSPPPPVPSYCPEPAHDEERVEHTPGAWRTHTSSTYSRTCGSDTVVLTEQDCSPELPAYGRRAAIHGFLTLEDREMVSEIVLKIKGEMEVVISEGGSLTTRKSTRLLNENYTIWSSEASRPSICPSTVPFSAVLPTKFQDGDGTSYPLPPSYETPLITVPGLFFKSSYALSVVITRTVSRRFRFLTKTKTISIPIIYNPQTRPLSPIQPSTDFLSDVKTMPEEFHQVVFQLLPRPKSTAQPIDLHLFLLAQIFAAEDTIPFHVQLTGPVSSLQEFLPASGDSKKATIVGSVVRQIVADFNGRQATRNLVLGHAKMSPRPPGPCVAADALHEASLDWDGEVRCKGENAVGTLHAGCVRIQDFILIELKPLGAVTCSQFVSLRHLHPIQLAI